MLLGLSATFLLWDQRANLYSAAFSMNLWLQLLPFVVTAAFCNVTLAEIFAYVAYNDSSKCIAYKALPAYSGPQLPAEG